MTPHRFHLLSPAALLLCGLLWHGAATAAAGYIQLVLGQATVWERSNTQRPAQKGIQIYEGDTIVTGASSNVQIRMSDDALIMVYSNSRIKIDRYIFSQSKDGKDSGTLQVLKGALRTVTGQIAQKNKDGFTVKTSVATIGVRGTDFDTAFIEPGSVPAGASPGTYKRVYSGATTLKTTAGSVNVNENEAAFVGLKPGDKPERLKEIPEFMRKLEKEGMPVQGQGQGQAQDIITLRHRTAEDIMPLIRPLLDSGAVLTGKGSQLVLKAPEARREALLAAIASFDIPLRRLQITVRFDNPASASNSVEITSRARGNEPVEQRLQVVGVARHLGIHRGAVVVIRQVAEMIRLPVEDEIAALVLEDQVDESLQEARQRREPQAGERIAVTLQHGLERAVENADARFRHRRGVGSAVALDPRVQCALRHDHVWPRILGAVRGDIIRADAAHAAGRTVSITLSNFSKATPGRFTNATLTIFDDESLVAPAGTPTAIVNKLNVALRAAVMSDELKAKLAADGTEPLASTPEEYAADIDKEETKWSAIVRKSGAKAE